MDQSDDKIFRRTIVGDSEIRDRTLALSLVEQKVLLSVDGSQNYFDLGRRLESRDFGEFEMAMVSLLRKGLIEALEVQPLSSHSDLLKADIEGFDPADFFSRSVGAARRSSGLVVDAKNNVSSKVKGPVVHVEDVGQVDLFITLSGEDVVKSSLKRKRMRKLVEVYPSPGSQRKKRPKQVLPSPENKWLLRSYFALIGFGFVTVLAAVLLI